MLLEWISEGWRRVKEICRSDYRYPGVWPHKGTGSTVSAAGVGLVVAESGAVRRVSKRSDAERGCPECSQRLRSQPASSNLEGVGNRPELPDEFLPRQDELTFMAL